MIPAVCDTLYNAKKMRKAAGRVAKPRGFFRGGEKMPKKPRVPCRFPGCPNLSDEPYCEVHRSGQARQYNRYERATDVNQKYGRRWKSIRRRYADTHPLCERCLAHGRYVPVEEVHHILPINRGGDHRESNLMSLCRSCHTKIHLEMGDR